MRTTVCISYRYRWLFYINPNYYGFSSTSYLLLSNFDSQCAGTELECFITSGEYALNQFNFDETNPAFHIMVCVFVYYVCCVYALCVIMYVCMVCMHVSVHVLSINSCFISHGALFRYY